MVWRGRGAAGGITFLEQATLGVGSHMVKKQNREKNYSIIHKLNFNSIFYVKSI